MHTSIFHPLSTHVQVEVSSSFWHLSFVVPVHERILYITKQSWKKPHFLFWADDNQTSVYKDVKWVCVMSLPGNCFWKERKLVIVIKPYHSALVTLIIKCFCNNFISASQSWCGKYLFGFGNFCWIDPDPTQFLSLTHISLHSWPQAFNFLWLFLLLMGLWSNMTFYFLWPFLHISFHKR